MGRGSGIRAAGSSSIQIDFQWQGRRCRERLRLPPTPQNIKYAQRLKAAIEHAIATNTFDYAKFFPRSKRRTTTKGTPLREAMLAYCLGLASQLEPETIEKYEHDAELIAAAFPGKTMETLTRPDVRDWVGRSSLSKKRLDNLLIPLRGDYRQENDDGITTHNPVQGFQIRRTRKTESGIDPFTRDEIDAIARTDAAGVWAFWAWTGPRSGELIALRWDDVDPACETIHIRRAVRVGREKAPKTASGDRLVHLLQPARDVLRSLQRTEGYVFLNPNTGRNWYEDRALARAFRKACEAAGVRYRYPYQLRHTFASWALSSGENPLWVAKHMGHRDVQMVLRVYGRYIPQMNPEAGQKMLGRNGNIKAA